MPRAGRLDPIRPQVSQLGARMRAAASSRLPPVPEKLSLHSMLSASRSRSSMEVPLVVVPDKTLFAQWFEELRATVGPLNARILRVGAGFDDWRQVLGDWTAPDGRRVVLATMQTARSDAFRTALTHGPHLFLVADEVHRLGSPANRKLLDETLFGPRLGLSATPERAGDDPGTSAIVGYFRGVLEPRYTLADARPRPRPHALFLSAPDSRAVRGGSGQVAPSVAANCPVARSNRTIREVTPGLRGSSSHGQTSSSRPRPKLTWP